MSSSLILYRIEQLPRKGTVTAVAHRDEKQLATELELTEEQAARGYLRARLTHHDIVKVKVLGEERPYEEIVAADAFYDRDRGFFVVESSRELARAAVRRLGSKAEGVILNSIELDLNKFLTALPGGVSILGAWASSRAPNPIRSRAVFGPGLQQQKEYKEMRDSGRISSVALGKYPCDGNPLRVNVSRWSTALFFEDPALATKLKFMEALARFRRG
jgi:hypothetical protein